MHNILRKAMFSDLTRVWLSNDKGKIAHRLHQKWQIRDLNLNGNSRLGSSLLHGAACDYSILQEFQFSIGKCKSNLCRCGCGVNESLEHVLLVCKQY